jgi:FdhD protein
VNEDETSVRVGRTFIDGKARVEDEDIVTREEPLEIRVNGTPVAVVMRTPGHDIELVRGFLASEHIVPGVDPLAEVASIRHCTTVDVPEAEDNVVLVVLAPDVMVDLAALRRNLFASSSCGICGKATIENAMRTSSRTFDGREPRLGTAHFRGLIPGLRARQDVFDRTGGLHAAGLFAPDGNCLVVREDVGRHNAVDKVIGHAIEHRLARADATLAVSGRISYEIAQKAAGVGIPVLAGVSAPTSLAIELARAANMTLVGFLRGDRMSVYAGSERIVDG